MLLAVVGGVAAYYQVFGTFAPYDDEGYVLTSLKSFVAGGVLYRDVYTQYGPFYYELFGGLFAVTGRSVSTDSGRAIVVVVWVAISGLFAYGAQAMTRNVLVALATMAVTLGTLPLLVAEPMHPVGLVCLLLAAIIALISSGWPRHPRATAALVGCCCAALVLTKVNVGVLAGISVIAAFALAHWSHRSMRVWRWVVVAGLALVPLLLLSADLDQDWVQRLLVLEWGALAATVIAACRDARDADDPTSAVRWLVVSLVAAVVAAVVIVVIALVLGSSMSDLIDGVVREPTHLRNIFVIAFPLPDAAIDWAIAAVVVALAWSRAPLALRASRVSSALVRLVGGLVVWLAVTASSPLVLGPASGRVALPAVIAWLAVLPPTGTIESRERSVARILLVILPLLEVLQAYPVAGTQAWAAALLFIPAGGLLVNDGLRELQSTLDLRGVELARWASVMVTAIGVALVAAFCVSGVLRPLDTAVRGYDANVSLDLNGTSHVHLGAGEVAQFEGLATAVRANCDRFISLPGFNSLYLWTGMRPPTGLNAGDWMFLLDGARQQRIVNAIRRVPRLCLVRNDAQLASWVAGAGQAAPPARPLLQYIDEAGFKSIGQFGPYVLQRR